MFIYGKLSAKAISVMSYLAERPERRDGDNVDAHPTGVVILGGIKGELDRLGQRHDLAGQAPRIGRSCGGAGRGRKQNTGQRGGGKAELGAH